MSILSVLRPSDWNAIAVYKETATYARDHGQEETYKNSLRANNVCRQAIECLIKKSPSHVISVSDIEEILIPTFGLDRIALVLAITILHRNNSRFDRALQKWAEQYPVKPDLGTLDNDRNEWLVIDADSESINILAGFILGKLNASP